MISTLAIKYYYQNNIEYKKARGNISEFAPCCKYLDETSEDFIKFDEKIEDKIVEIF